VIRMVDGFFPQLVNHGDLELAMQNFRFTEDFKEKSIMIFDVEWRIQVIRISKSKVLDWKTVVRAAHLYVEVENQRQQFIRFLKTFSKRNELGFPLE